MLAGLVLHSVLPVDLSRCIDKRIILCLQVASWGYPSVLMSASTQQGLPELHSCLTSKTSVVAGPSGVGKSSVINALHLLAGSARTSNGAKPGLQHNHSTSGSGPAEGGAFKDVQMHIAAQHHHFDRSKASGMRNHAIGT